MQISFQRIIVQIMPVLPISLQMDLEDVKIIFYHADGKQLH